MLRSGLPQIPRFIGQGFFYRTGAILPGNGIQIPLIVGYFAVGFVKCYIILNSRSANIKVADNNIKIITMRYISNVINRVNPKGRTNEKYLKRMIKISDFYIINMLMDRLIDITDFFVKSFNPKSLEIVTGNLLNCLRSAKNAICIASSVSL